MNWIVLIWLLAVTHVSVNHVYCASRDRAGRFMLHLVRYSRYHETLRGLDALHDLMSSVIRLLKNINKRFGCAL
ncbi:hypothetical protein T265_14117, partial [Opisthorchis viverrini]